MAKLIGTQIAERGKELKPARLLVFKLWEENPQITGAEMEQALKEKGFEISKFTRIAWLARLRKRSVRTHEAKRRPESKPKPARLLAFKLWEENPHITGAEMEQALKEKGFQATRSTYYNWLKSFREGKDVGTYEGKRRPQVSKSAQLLAFKLWQENPQITATELGQAIKKEGFKASNNTYYNWLKSFKNGKVVGTYEGKPVAAVESSVLSLDQIIKAAGSVETLSLLFYQGVMREMTRKDAVNHLLKQDCVNKDSRITSLKRMLDEITRDRNRVIREYNEKLARVKIGTLTLDESTRRLIPKT